MSRWGGAGLIRCLAKAALKTVDKLKLGWWFSCAGVQAKPPSRKAIMPAAITALRASRESRWCHKRTPRGGCDCRVVGCLLSGPDQPKSGPAQASAGGCYRIPGTWQTLTPFAGFQKTKSIPLPFIRAIFQKRRHDPSDTKRQMASV
jgi:hypothetical protein